MQDGGAAETWCQIDGGSEFGITQQEGVEIEIVIIAVYVCLKRTVVFICKIKGAVKIYFAC